LDRTQKVAGSSPASSTRTHPLQTGNFALQGETGTTPAYAAIDADSRRFRLAFRRRRSYVHRHISKCAGTARGVVPKTTSFDAKETVLAVAPTGAVSVEPGPAHTPMIAVPRRGRSSAANPRISCAGADHYAGFGLSRRSGGPAIGSSAWPLRNRPPNTHMCVCSIRLLVQRGIGLACRVDGVV
jgi:hypothetical protein